MAANEDEVRLRLTAETLGYRKAWADVRVQTARDLASIKSTVTSTLAQTRTAAATQLAGIKQVAASSLGQTRVNVANQLAQVRTQTAQNLAQIRVNAAQQLQSIRQNTTQTLGSIGSQFESAGRRLTVGLTVPLTALAGLSIKAALELDTFRNRLIAIEGSVQGAERRIVALRKLAQESVGVTTRTALDTYSQFAAIGGITEETINRQIKAFGKLNALFSIQDPFTFNRNLVQIFEKNFNQRDIREALGRVPIFNQLLQEAFGTANPEKLRALRAAGKLTLETFMSGLAEAVETDSRLANVRESLSVRLQKTFERIQFALAPIGETILRTIEPFIDPAVKLIEGLGKAFADLPSGVRLGLVALGGIAAIAGPAVFVIGSLVSAISSIAGAVAAVGAPVIAAVAAVVVAVTAAAAGLYLAWRTNFGGIQDITFAVFDAVRSHVSAVLTELLAIWQRVYPTLQSLTVKALGAIEGAWRSLSSSIGPPIKAAFDFISGVLVGGLRQIGNLVDFWAKLVDGDWKGAWDAFSRVAYEASRAFSTVLEGMRAAIVTTLAKLIFLILTFGNRFASAAGELARKFVMALGVEIATGYPTIRKAITTALVFAALGVNVAEAASIVGGAFTASLRDAVRNGAQQAKQGAVAGLTSAQQAAVDAALAAGDALVNKAFQRPRPAEDLGGTKKRGNDKAHQEAVRRLEQQEREIEEVYQRETEALKRQYDLQLISSRSFTNDIVDLANERFEKLEKVYQREIAAAKKQSEREKFNNDLIKARGERDKAIQEAQDAQYKREVDLLKEHREALLDLQDKYDAQAIASVRARAELGASTYEDAENKAFEIQTKAFDRRLQAARDDEARFYETQKDINDANEELAQQYSDRIAAIVAEQETAQREHDARLEDDRQKDLERRRKYLDAVFDLEKRYQANEEERKKREIERGLASPFAQRRILALSQRLELEVNEINRREKAEVRALDAEEAHAKREYEIQNESLRGTKEYYDNLSLLHDQYEAQRQQARDRADQDRKDSTDKANADVEKEDPLSADNLFGGDFAERVRAIKEAAAAAGGHISSLRAEIRALMDELREATNFSALNLFAQSLASLFVNLRDAVLGAVDAMIFSGKSLKAALADAFKDALAQTAKFLARKAWIKALEALAEVAAHLAALDLAGAARWAAAAAGWGALGAAVAAAGGAVAGSGRGSASAMADYGARAGANGSTAQRQEPTTVREERDRSPRVIIVHHENTLKLPDGFTVAELGKAHSTNDAGLQRILEDAVNRYG